MQRAETQRTINELGPKLARTFKASSDLLNMRKVEHTLGGLKKYELANEMKVKADLLLEQETAAFNVDV
jgi:hypothetical protein